MNRRVFLGSALAGALRGQTSEQRAKAVVDDTLKALGGDAYLNMKDRVEAGRAYSFYRENLSGLSRAKFYARYLTRPEPPQPGFFGLRERQAFGKDEDNGAILTEDNGWEYSFRGARPMPPALVTRFKESTLHNFFYILRQRLGEPGLIAEWLGSEVFENQPCDLIRLLDNDNRQVSVYIHRSTRLPVYQTWNRRDPATKELIEEASRWSKYRDVGGGVMWPFVTQRERDKEKIYEMYAESVTINQNLTDNLFLEPAGMKLLPAKK